MMSISRGGRTITARSVRLPASWRSRPSRLCTRRLKVMPGAEGRQHPRKEVVPGADDRDVEATAGHPLELRQRVFGFPEALGNGAGTLQHLLAGGREEGLATDAFEQRQADVGRELLDLRRDRRLRQVQLFGGAREVHVPGCRREHPQLPQRHVLHSPPAYPYSRYSEKLMLAIESFNFSSDMTGGNVFPG